MMMMVINENDIDFYFSSLLLLGVLKKFDNTLTL